MADSSLEKLYQAPWYPGWACKKGGPPPNQPPATLDPSHIPFHGLHSHPLPLAYGGLPSSAPGEGGTPSVHYLQPLLQVTTNTGFELCRGLSLQVRTSRGGKSQESVVLCCSFSGKESGEDSVLGSS